MKKLNILACIGISGLSLILQNPAQGQTPGTLKWSFTANNGITSSAAAVDANQTIYFADWQTGMYAVNSNGSLKWSATPSFGYRLGESSPALSADGSTVYYSLVGYVAGDGTYLLSGGITARSTSTGAEVWHYFTPTNAPVYNPPMSRIAVGSDGTIYFVGTDLNFYAISSSGALKWSATPPGGCSIETCPAIASDGSVYVGSAAGSLVGYYANGAQKNGFQTPIIDACNPAFDSDGTIYVGGFGGLYALNKDGSLRWKYSNFQIKGQFVLAGPTIDKNGVIYFDCPGADSGTPPYSSYLYAINPDGTLKWQFATEESQFHNSLGNQLFSSPSIASDGTIYVGTTTSGSVYAVNPDGSQKWVYSVGTNIYSPTTIGSDGTIYVGALDGKFYAIYGSAPLDSQAAWPKFSANALNSGAVLPDLPQTPSGFATTATNHQVNLTWNATASYNIKVSTNSGGPYTTIASLVITNLVTTNVVNGTTYYYVISSVVNGLESSNSSEISATPNPPIPQSPTGVTLVHNSSGNKLSWNASTWATSYNVKTATTSGGPYTIMTNLTSTSYLAQIPVSTNFPPPVNYYVISALNAVGESANSSQVSF